MIKALMFLVILGAVVSEAQSKKVMQTAGSIQASAPTKEKSSTVMKGLNVGLVYSSAPDIEVRGHSGDTLIKMKYAGESAPGIGLRYAQIPNKNFGFVGGVTYHFNREVKSIDATVTDGVDSDSFSGRTIQAPKYSLLILEPNAAFGMGENFYVLAGPNYVHPMKSGGWGRHDLKDGYGMQVGCGFTLDQFFGELQYQTLNPQINIDIPGVSIDESRLWGLSLRAGATF